MYYTAHKPSSCGFFCFSFTVHVCRLLGCVYNVTVLTFSIQNCFKKCIEIKSLSPTINSHPLLLLSNAHKKTLKYYCTFKYIHVMQISLCPHHFACLQLRNNKSRVDVFLIDNC